MQRSSRWTQARPLGVLLRAVGLGAGATAGAVGALALVDAPVHDLLAELEAGTAWTAMPLDRVVVTLAAVALSGCAFWLVVVTVATAVEAATGASSAALRAISPHVVRRAVLLCCGLAVGTSALLPPAMAAEHGGLAAGAATPQGKAPLSGKAALTGLPLPDRVAGELREAPRRPADQTPSGQSHRTPSSRVVDRLSVDPDVVEVAAVERRPGSYLVRSGDSLWSIAERLLPGASGTEVDATWRRIHRANRRLIGPDPDLIIPGTALRLPPMTSGPHHLHGPGVLGAPHERKDAS